MPRISYSNCHEMKMLMILQIKHDTNDRNYLMLNRVVSFDMQRPKNHFISISTPYDNISTIFVCGKKILRAQPRPGNNAFFWLDLYFLYNNWTRNLTQGKHLRQLENGLWKAADQLRANSKLTASEYSMSVLGLIFLRHAYNRFLIVKDQIELELPDHP